MKITLNIALLLSILGGFTACIGQNKESRPDKTNKEQPIALNIGDTVSEIGKDIRCIFQDKQNNFWFATNGQGVFKYDGKVLLQLTDKHGLGSNFVWNIQQGQDGTMYFKTRDNLCFFDGKKFNTNQALDNFGLTDKARTANNQTMLLLGYCFENKLAKAFELPQTSPLKGKFSSTPYAIYCSYLDSQGNIWFGTESRGVCKYDGQTYTWLNEKELGMPVRSIFEDKNGHLWIGNNGYGLFRYDGKTVTNFTRQQKLENPDFLNGLKGKAGTLSRVWTITDDRQGNLWIGTIDAGLWKYDGRVLTNYTTKDGLTSNSVWTVYCDKIGHLWIGAGENGLTKYDGQTFIMFKI